ncbi:Pectinesterase [Actinidia chinensis var. chinensis]|uniref:Pectinesterase n=1 Tax=Actinidia chinensis var. chinensis TaxID=1590841 RepID=A0A2R6RJT9_ACTCC|nr:Pectinesterase [Actinidia chinensis var. chinensis]
MRRGVVIAVATAISLMVISAVLTAIFATRHRSSRPPEQPTSAYPTAAISLHEACKATRHPQTCKSSLAPPPNHQDPTGVLQHATNVSAANLKTAQTMVAQILDTASDNQNLSKAVRTCREVLSNAEYRMASTVETLPRGEIKDARAWMSAALVYETACMSGLNKTGFALPFVSKTVSYLASLANFTSDALSMMVAYDVYGNQTSSWGPPRTERDGFWEKYTGSGNGSGMWFNGGVPSSLTANVTVCKGSGGEKCDYKTVQEAVNAGPDNDGERRYVIRIKEGVYNETVRVSLEKKNVVFWGQGMGKTVITGYSNVGQPGMTTYDSATVGVLGDGFMAKDLTIQNTAGTNAHQAVAFRSDSDQSVIENCEFIGNQDTLCANSLRQFYKSCRIQGTIDFVFGFSASAFHNCLILISPRGPNLTSDSTAVVTAHGRFDPAQSTGFVFFNCTVNGTEEYMSLYNKNSNPKPSLNFLGRPWKEYSRTVFLDCYLGSLIAPGGWMRWDGDFGLSTLFYGEFGNTGLGSNSSEREKWSSQISGDHIGAYSVQNFIQGDKWIPSSSS